MRIAIISNANPPHLPSIGGAGRVVEMEKEILEKEGHDVRVFCARPFFYSLSRRSVIVRLLFHLFDLFPSFSLRGEIQAFNPEILYTHNLTGCGFATPRSIRRRGIRWIHKLHDVQLFEPSGQIRVHESFALLHRAWRHIWALLRRIALGQPDIVISPTRWLLDEHRRYGFFKNTDCRVISNLLLVESSPCVIPVEAGIQEIDELHRLKFPGLDSRLRGNDTTDGVRKNDLIFVGRLDEDKGIDLVIAAWERLRPQGVSLTLVGSGSWEDRLRDRRDPLLSVVGPLSPDGVMRALSQSRVLVFASRILENQPTVILEAFAAGCHVVATDVGGVRETVGERGIIVPAEDVEALAEALKRVLVDSSGKPTTSFNVPTNGSRAFLDVFISSPLTSTRTS